MKMATSLPAVQVCPAETRAHSYWRDIAALALIAGLVLLFFWRIITPRLEDRAAFPPGDFTDQFWAFRMYEARALAEGRLPLWSENFNSGHPFLADVQSAIFYPIGLLFTLSAVLLRGGNFTLLDLEWEAIVHFILAGTFTYLFAWRLLRSRPAALVSAITFAFGGYLTAYPPQQLAILETATWLPLALLCLDLATEPEEAQHSGRYYIFTGFILGIAALAGHPQTFLFILYACAIYFVWKILRISTFYTFHVLRFALGLMVAAGLASAQWIPTLEYQAVSTRTAISWAEAARGFPTIDPLQMILPGFTSAFQSPLYIGVFPLWLALAALFVNRSRVKVFWAALALGSLLVAFGFYVFAYPVLYLFGPGFGLFRDQERLALIVSFSLALLAGYGFRDWLGPALDSTRWRRAWALLPAGLTVSAMMLFSFYIAGAQHSSGRLAFLLDRSGLMVLLFTLATALAATRLSPSPLRERVGVRVGWGLTALAIALIAFDLFSVNNAAYNAHPTPRYPETPIVRAIQADRDIFRVVDERQMPGHFGIAYQLEEIGGISPLRVGLYDRLLKMPQEIVWPLLNVRYVITDRSEVANADAMASEGDTRLLRLQNTLPRAWLVGFAQGNMDDAATLAAMQKAEFNARREAYVADSIPLEIVPSAALTPVNWERRDPEHLVMSVNTPTNQLLMLSEVYYPGWRATIDGAPTPILRADYALRAVTVPAGSHQIEMIYDPWSIKVGIGVSLATLLLTAFGTMFLIWKERK